MAVYTAYSDDAGIGDPSGEFLVCGYLGTESTWDFVRRAWRDRVLDGQPQISELHMTRIRSPYWRAKCGMSFYDSEKRVGEAVSVIYSTGALDAVASVVKRSTLHEVSSNQQFKKLVPGLDTPDYVCYMAYTMLVLQRTWKLHPDATKVNFVFAAKEETKRGMKLIVEALRMMLANEDPGGIPIIRRVRICRAQRRSSTSGRRFDLLAPSAQLCRRVHEDGRKPDVVSP